MKTTKSRLKIISNSRNMLQLAWQADKWVTMAFYGSEMLGSLLPLLMSIIFARFIDILSRKPQTASATLLITLIALLGSRYFVSLGSDFLQRILSRQYLSLRFHYLMQDIIALRFFGKLAELDIAHVEDAEMQNLLIKAASTAIWYPPNFLEQLSEFAGDIVTYILMFFILIPFGWWILLLFTLVCLPRLLLQMKYGKLQWSLYGAGIPGVKRMLYFRELFPKVTAIKEMRIFQSQDALLAKFHAIQNELFELSKEPLRGYPYVMAIPPLFEAATLFFLAYLQLPNVLAQHISIGAFALFMSLLDQVSASVLSAGTNFSGMYETSFHVDDLLKVLAIPPQITEVEQPVRFEKIEPPTIEFKHVSFSYPNRRQVLKDISFTIQPGESVALVGANGAGKSTIIKLLCRFYDVTEGEILINGINLKELSLSQWYRFLGTLFQDFMRYQFTVRENITLGDKDSKYDEDLMKDSAEKSGAGAFIDHLPDGFEQQLGRQFANGEELSGGLWQKLAIARAFYRQAPILILDEPTSAIDAEAEQEIFDSLHEVYADKTLLLVSHRFSTVRNANTIYVLEDGRIIEQGTHEYLLQINGKYASMFLTQAKGYQ